MSSLDTFKAELRGYGCVVRTEATWGDCEVVKRREVTALVSGLVIRTDPKKVALRIANDLERALDGPKAKELQAENAILRRELSKRMEPWFTPEGLNDAIRAEIERDR